MTVSVIICTRNRAEHLRETLASLSKLAIPARWEVELLVVDNGSTDQTQKVIRDAGLTNISLRQIQEPVPGLSRARNTGLKHSSGTVILFTDDDVRVPSNWIEGMCHPIITNAADAVAGGVIFPAHVAAALSNPPYSYRKAWFACTDKLDRNSPDRMVGANMAFRRAILEEVPGFDIELGAGALGYAEETLFTMQLVAAGYRLKGAFNIDVEHHLDIARLTPASILEMSRKMGRSSAFTFHHWSHKSSRLVVPRLLSCHIIRHLKKFAQLFGKREGNNISSADIQSETDLAFYREYIVQRRRPFKY